MLRSLVAFGAFGSFALVASVIGAGCSSKSSSGGGGTGSGSQADEVDCVDGGCTACSGPTTPASETVSFSTTIIPIFQISCGTGGNGCHGAPMGSSQNLFLSYPIDSDAGTDGPAVYTSILQGIVGVKSLEAPTVDIVNKGNPSESFLMNKIDGDMCSMMSQCAAIAGLELNATINVPCGIQMPQNSPALGPTEATLFWNWIAEGANNN